jgi:hypothetical protein
MLYSPTTTKVINKNNQYKNSFAYTVMVPPIATIPDVRMRIVDVVV